MIYTKTSRNTIKITAAGSKAERVFVPDRIDGLPVDEIGTRAFADLSNLQEISLPDGILTIGSYAFYNCRNLKTILLTDSTEELHDGAIRMCPSLEEVRVRILRGRYRLIKDLLGDTDSMLSVKLILPDGEAKLVFPGYIQEYREDPWARVIHQSIVGTGYSYRVCVTRTSVDYEQYDACFLRGELDGEPAADRIALARLMYPYRLGTEAGRRYREFLVSHAAETLCALVREGRKEEVRFLVRELPVPREALDQALPVSLAEQQTEMTGILMDAFHECSAEDAGIETFSFDEL